MIEELRDYVRSLLRSMYADSFDYVNRVAPKDEITSYKISDSTIEKFGHIVYALAATFITHLLNIEAADGIAQMSDTEHLKDGYWTVMYKALLFSSDDFVNGQKHFSISPFYFDVGVVDLMEANLITDYTIVPDEDCGGFTLSDFNHDGLFFIIVATKNPLIERKLNDIGLANIADPNNCAFHQLFVSHSDAIKKAHNAQNINDKKNLKEAIEKYTIDLVSSDGNGDCDVDIARENSKSQVNIIYNKLCPAPHVTKVTIEYDSETPIPNYKHKLVLDSSNFDFSTANSKLSDIRIFKDLSGQNALPYYLYSFISKRSRAVVWVKLELSNSSNEFYLFTYCDPNMQSLSDAEPFRSVSDRPYTFTYEGGSVQLPKQNIIPGSVSVLHYDNHNQRWQLLQESEDYRVDYESGILALRGGIVGDTYKVDSYSYIDAPLQYSYALDPMDIFLPSDKYNSINNMVRKIVNPGILFEIKGIKPMEGN